MAIVQAQEKQIAKLEKEIETIDKEKQQQIQLFEKIGRKHTRSSRLRLKRSQLGQLIFGKTQKRKLKTFLTQWIQFYSQRIIVRANFQLRQETIRQNQRVIQLEKDDAFSKASLLVDSTREEMTKLTILHTQQQKKIQCRLCKSIYTQAQNHRLACAYHPGAYEVACVRSCRTRQGGPIEATCMLHRAKRWLCCDATEEGRYGQNGCKQRFHLAIHEDPVLEKIVAKKQQEDDEEKNRYQQKIDEIDTRNLMGQKHQQIKAVVNDIEKELGEKRKLVALYEKITSRK